jgi:threonyl-tRNA synthetase
VGEESRWNQALESLKKALEVNSIPHEVDEGGGAFYGPKIDMKIKDALGREWQMSTIQFDFNIPERFDMSYVGEDGKDHRPYMVHRALLGSLERFFGILIEHYAGAFPLWLAPEQVRVLPLTGHQIEYAEKISGVLADMDFRAGIDRKPEKIGAKIRRAQLEKIPYMLILGSKEIEGDVVAVRSRKDGDLGSMSMNDFTELLKNKNIPE